jgi:hypothetical protein
MSDSPAYSSDVWGQAKQDWVDITWEALQSPDWNDSQLSQLQAAWQMDNTLPDVIAALETERSFDVDYINKVRSSLAEWQKLRKGLLSEAQCGCGNRDALWDVGRE